MYRNIYFNSKKNVMWLSTWDKDGNRIDVEENFVPYLYVKDQSATDGISIYEESLKKLQFSSVYKRREYSEANKHTYYNLNPEAQYLMDRYHGQEHEESFVQFPLKTYMIDIEVFAPNGFPHPTDANDPITVITVYDTLTKTYNVFGNGATYYTQANDVKYYQFENEETMIKGFVRWWRKDFPDVVSGWYSYGFDIPYLCNRINRVYDDENAACKLSPVGRAWHNENVKRRFGAKEITYDQLWTICGVSHIDMQAAYYKLCPKKLANYSLNSVCEHEKVGQKMEHEGSLADWWLTNPMEYIDYNIQDVRLLVNLESKLKYLTFCRTLAYSGLCSIDGSLGTLSVVSGLVTLEALLRDRIVSSFDHSEEIVQYEGGYVSEPEPGFARDIVSVDANSMYPNCIISLNISNETKVGRFEVMPDGMIKITTETQTEKTMTGKEFMELVHKANIAIAPNRVLYSQNKVGIFPSLCDRLYQTRVDTKAEMFRLSKILSDMKNDSKYDEKSIRDVELKVEFLDLRQWLMKINLNSIYGAMGEKHFILFDLDLSRSVTSMGRSCIKSAAKYIDEYATEFMGTPTEIGKYTDTDSRYFTLSTLLKKEGVPFMIDEDTVHPRAYEISQEIVNYLNKKTEELLCVTFNSKHNTLRFKRESLAPSALWQCKKKYVVYCKDDEGIKCDEFHYTGIDVVKSSTPKKLRPMIKDIIETLIKTQDRDSIYRLLKKHWEEYKKMDIMDKVVSMSANSISKPMAKTRTENGKMEIPKGTPRHVCCAIRYNLMLKQDGLDGKYEALKDSDKVKLMYVKPNKYKVNSFGFNTKIPAEYANDFAIDDAMMFQKTVLSIANRIFGVIGWTLPDPTSEEKVDLMSFLGIQIHEATEQDSELFDDEDNT